MKIAVIGANGQLGSDVCRACASRGDEVVPLTHAELEVGNLDSVARALREVDPAVIVNTSAMHHVEDCERRPEEAFAVNGLGARNLALVAGDLGAVLIHVSTDYVFDGAKRSPYVETDLPRPLNVYGNTKLAGEHFVRSLLPKHFILRTSALYGQSPCRGKGGLNFVDLMLKLGREREEVRVVDDEIVSPTPTVELAGQIARLAHCDGYGTYHATAEGSCSWYAFAREIFRLRKVKARLAVARAGEFPAKVPRPSYSVLENRGLKTAGMNAFRPWEEGLRCYLASTQAAAPWVEERQGISVGEKNMNRSQR